MTDTPGVQSQRCADGLLLCHDHGQLNRPGVRRQRLSAHPAGLSPEDGPSLSCCFSSDSEGPFLVGQLGGCSPWTKHFLLEIAESRSVR